MKSIWSGSISFGLVNIPVKLYSASVERALNFEYLHQSDHGKIRYQKVCELEKKEVPFEQIARGYEIESGRYIIIDENEFLRADPKRTKSIEIVGFCQHQEIPEILIERPYFLEPVESADKPYLLLKTALEKSAKVGIAKFVLRGREHLAEIVPLGDILILNQLRFSDEIRNQSELRKPQKEELLEDEVDIAQSLIDRLTKKFDPTEFSDTFTKEMLKIIEAKSKGGETIISQEPEVTASQDLMEILKQSLEKTKVAR